MINLIPSAGTIALWTLPLLPCANIYESFKTPKVPGTQPPFINNYAKSLESKVHADMGDYLEKQKIRQDLKIIEMPNDGVCTAHGSNSFSNAAAIICCPNFEQIDSHAFRWAFKHEISHLKHNDQLLIAIARTVSFIASIALLHLGLGLQPLTTALLTLAIDVVCSKVFRNYVENRADHFANQHATTDELKGGLRILHALREMDQGKLSLFHPSTDSRIQRLEKELIKRKVTYVVEQKEIIQLKKLITKSQEEDF